MKVTVGGVERVGRRRAPAPFKPGRTDVIVGMFDEGIARIRLARERVEVGLYRGSPMTSETSYFLDGTILRAVVTLDQTTYERSTMGAAAIPVRTKDVADFGRLEQAAKALVAQMQQFGPDNPPSPEQQEVLVSSYQRILTWREKAHSQLANADGQIDVVAVLLRQVMGA